MINSYNNKSYSFSQFGFKNEILCVVKELGYSIPTDIQISCIPKFMKGYDIIGIAKTGSGKTASFVLPILNNLINNNVLQVLVLAPTRELAIQICDCFKLFSKYINNIKTLALYGGQKYSIQISLLKKGSQIIVATPGRLLDYIKNKIINLSFLKVLVIDEADEMLRMGFIYDVEKIISNLNKNRQTALFSATMPPSIKKIVLKFMKNPKEISVLGNNNIVPLNIKQYYCCVFNKYKLNTLIKFLEIEEYNSVIIFVRTKSTTTFLSSYLEKRGYVSSPLNGDMNQFLREKIIKNLRNGKLTILVATDIAARGLDINNISLIINYDIPLDFESYIHRIGRTGRAGNIGKAILLLERRNRKYFFSLKKFINSQINEIKVPNDKILLEKRLFKLSNLIKLNIVNNKNNIFNFLNKILKIIQDKYYISQENLLLSLLKIVYEKYFSYFTYENISSLEEEKDKKFFQEKKVIYFKIIGKLHLSNLNNFKNFVFNYLKVDRNKIIWLKTNINFSYIKVFFQKKKKLEDIKFKFYFLNKKFILKRIYSYKNKKDRW